MTFFYLSAFPDQSEDIVKKGKKSKNPSDTREVAVIGKKTEVGRDKTSLQTFSFHEQCTYNEKPALRHKEQFGHMFEIMIIMSLKWDYLPYVSENIFYPLSLVKICTYINI